VTARESLPTDLANAHAMILAERAARLQAEVVAASAQAEAESAKAEAAIAQADRSSTEALISHLKLEIEKLRRTLYGTRSERKARLLATTSMSCLPASATKPKPSVAPFEQPMPSNDGSEKLDGGHGRWAPSRTEPAWTASCSPSSPTKTSHRASAPPSC
jgi:hypothetical protein